MLPIFLAILALVVAAWVLVYEEVGRWIMGNG